MPDGNDQASAEITEPEPMAIGTHPAPTTDEVLGIPVDPPPPTADEARAALQRDREERVEKANTTVTEILKHYGCRIQIEQTVSGDGRILARATIVAS